MPNPSSPVTRPRSRTPRILAALGAATLALTLFACGGGGGGSDSGGDSGGSGGGVTPSGRYTVLAWNDLGMHCVDGKDYSVFAILPPYNNLRAQVVRRDAGAEAVVGTGLSVSYEAVADETGSINTGSATKTNFWKWVQALFGAAPAPDVGLTGNPTPSATPAPMGYDAASRTWQADGLPITPLDDAGQKNFYPMVAVVARDAAGAELARTQVVLPVSDEMTCTSCHASDSGVAARPAAGWVHDADPEKDWKKNILRLHDERHPDAVAVAGQAATYTQGTLLASAMAGQPTLCAGCHQSNALATPALAGIAPLTTALHARHADVIDPATGTTLEANTTRSACYSCHPGSVTQCLRGAMGNAVDASGTPTMDCQSCHGPMSLVGHAGREGWLDEPSCQNCHDRASANGAAFTRHLSVFSSGTKVRATRDRRFATTPDVPLPGKSLYRASTGHGGLACEACHGATHAEYPSSHANDNVQSIALQGHAGTVRECSVCHASVPSTTTGGPHGLHPIGSSWVSAHGDRVESGGRSGCASCHGDDFRGTPLSEVKVARSFSTEHGTRRYGPGDPVGCYDCHNGPGGGD